METANTAKDVIILFLIEKNSLLFVYVKLCVSSYSPVVFKRYLILSTQRWNSAQNDSVLPEYRSPMLLLLKAYSSIRASDRNR